MHNLVIITETYTESVALRHMLGLDKISPQKETDVHSREVWVISAGSSIYGRRFGHVIISKALLKKILNPEDTPAGRAMTDWWETSLRTRLVPGAEVRAI